MEAKEKPIGGVKTPTGNDKAGENPSAESIPYRLPYGQAVPFVAYEKVAGGAKGLVRLGQEVCPKFDKSNYSKAKKPDETGVTLYRPIIKAWQGAYPEIAAKQPRRHESQDRPHKITLRVSKALYRQLQQAQRGRTMQDTIMEMLMDCVMNPGKTRTELWAENTVLKAQIIKLKGETKK